MTTMISEVYDALKSAGADDQKARAAAEAMANSHNEILRLWGRIELLQWMVGFNLIISVATLWKLFSLN